MQALGAYGFLARVKGKKYFMNHIPEGNQIIGKKTYRGLGMIIRYYTD